MRKKRTAQAARRAGRGLGGKILRARGAGKAAQAESDQHKAFFQDIRRIAGRNADVDDIRHDERHQKLKRGLEQLEARGQDRLQAVGPQVNKQFFHGLFLLFLLLFNGFERLRHIDCADLPPQGKIDKQTEHQRQRG